MHQNISLGANGVDRVRSLQKIPTRLCGTNFCTCSAHFAPSFVSNQMVPNAPKWYETLQNISIGSNGVDRVHSLRKIPTRLRGTNFCTSSAHFTPSFVRQPNGPECTQIVQNEPKRHFGIQWGGSGAFVVKNSDATIPTRLRGTNFCTRSVRFAPSFLIQPNGPKCIQIV